MTTLRVPVFSAELSSTAAAIGMDTQGIIFCVFYGAQFVHGILRTLGHCVTGADAVPWVCASKRGVGSGELLLTEVSVVPPFIVTQPRDNDWGGL